jgi:hypothetical protein
MEMVGKRRGRFGNLPTAGAAAGQVSIARVFSVLAGSSPTALAATP